jgi:hypothetical protein
MLVVVEVPVVVTDREAGLPASPATSGVVVGHHLLVAPTNPCDSPYKQLLVGLGHPGCGWIKVRTGWGPCSISDVAQIRRGGFTGTYLTSVRWVSRCPPCRRRRGRRCDGRW